MQTKAELQNKPKQSLSTVNKNLQKQQDTTKNKKKPNVRTTEYKRMEEIFLTDPDSVTHEEFLFFQSAVGYRRVMQLLNEGKRRKQLRKIDGTGKIAKNLQQNKEQEKTDTKQQSVIQRKKLSQVNQKSGNEPIQKNASTNNTYSATSLPGNLRSGLENLSGIDLSDVSVHKNSEKPQQVGALAYTQGNNIHIAPGQEKHLPHEGWHAVQQKQGRVAPTLQMKTGTFVNDDAGLEKEADIMGSKAMKVGSKTDTIQLKKSSNIKQENNVIQRTTATEDKIQRAYYGEKSDNVKKIQRVLMELNYWTGSINDKPTGYFGEVTKSSLISYQTEYMRLKENELYDKKNNYVGCGPKTTDSLNTWYKVLTNSSIPEDVKNSIMKNGKKTKNKYIESNGTKKDENANKNSKINFFDVSSIYKEIDKRSKQGTLYPLKVTSPVWKQSDEDYSPAVQSILLELNFDWYFADSIEEQDKIVKRAEDIRADVSNGFEWFLDKASKFTSAAADEFSWFLGGSPSANERDKWLEMNQWFQTDLQIKDDKTLKSGMFIASLLMPGPGSEAKGIGKGLKTWIKHGTYNEIKEKLGKEGVEKFLNAMRKGIVSGVKENGIKLISGEGIEYAGKYYKYELKVLGKNMSHYRILGNFDEKTGHIIFEKLVNFK